MNFLNPAVLLGLIAAAAPLVFHLLSKRRTREVSFPSIRLLEQLKSDRIRLLKLKQLLLLLLRTLIIIAIVMGFARPALRSTFRANAHTAAVIIVDGTASMSYIDNGEMLFERARRRAGEILGLLSDGDRAAVLVMGTEPVLLQPGMTVNIRMLADQLDTVEPSLTGGDPNAAFDAAMALLETSPAVNRELYYLTDGAAASLPDSLSSISDIRLYTIGLGPSEHRGAVIERLHVENKIIAPGREVTFVAEGTLSGGARTADISFILDDERRGTAQVTPDNEGRFTARFSAIPESPGWLAASVRSGSGFYEVGETSHCAVYVPEAVNVLIVGDRAGDASVLSQILDSAAIDSSLIIETRVTSGEDRFSGYDVVIIAGVEEFDDASYQSLLASVIRDGAGLVVIPPSGQLTPLYAQKLFRDLFPARISGQVRMQTEGRLLSAAIDQFDYSHPIMREISPGSNLTLTDITSYHFLEAPAEARVFARFGDGTMAFADMDCGAGKAVLFTPDMDMVRNELAFSGVFIPVFLRTVQYLSDTLPDVAELETGTVITERFSVPQTVSQITVRHENEPAIRSTFTIQGGSAQLTGFVPDSPGFHSVLADGIEIQRLAVNLPADEIRFSRAPDSRFRERFRGVSWKMLEDSDTIAEAVTGDRYGTELAGAFLGMALLLLAAEMILSRRA